MILKIIQNELTEEKKKSSEALNLLNEEKKIVLELQAKIDFSNNDQASKISDRLII
jgi:hypothetical protein